VDAANINLEEIQLGKLALDRATMDHIKQLAQMMVNDHQKAYDDLSALAKSKSISIPAEPGESAQNDYKKLSDEKPSDFDKDYCDKMVDGHKDAIDKFQKAANDAKDADIKNWANSMLPSLRSHLDESMKCQEECKKMDKM
jgi:putative membrane protein